MVDLSTGQGATAMKPNEARKWIDPEQFRLSRHRAELNRKQAAEMLDVTLKTIRNWEESRSPVPYTAFRVMRLLGGYVLNGKAWEGWTMWKGKLYSPEGRSFEPHELRHISNYFTSARLFLQERKSLKSQTPNHVTIASDTPSSAAALLGAEPCRSAIIYPFPAGGRQKVVSGAMPVPQAGDIAVSLDTGSSLPDAA